MTDSTAAAPHTAAAPGAPAAPAPQTGTGLIPPSNQGGPSRFIADVIVQLGYVDRERADAAVDISRKQGKRTGQVLLETGAITTAQLAQALAERFGLDFVDLGLYHPDEAALNTINHTAARRFEAAPIGYDEDRKSVV